MAQSGKIEVEVEAVPSPRIRQLVDTEVAEIRASNKRVIKEAEENNRRLARLQEQLGTLNGTLAMYGIELVIGDDR